MCGSNQAISRWGIVKRYPPWRGGLRLEGGATKWRSYFRVSLGDRRLGRNDLEELTAHEGFHEAQPFGCKPRNKL